MRDFHNAISTLLETFARGIAVIKRKKERVPPADGVQRENDRRLSKSLKRSKIDVERAYGRDLARFGEGIAVGDAEAHSSLAAILLRLNAGFVTVIERFTKGHSTRTDYTALMNLSHASRKEAINTISALSLRISQTSLSLSLSLPPSPAPHHRKHRRKKRSSSSSSAPAPAPTSSKSKPSRSKNSSSTSISISNALSETGWVKSKRVHVHHVHRKQRSPSPKTSGSSTPRALELRPAIPTSASTPALASVPRHSPPPPPYTPPSLAQRPLREPTHYQDTYSHPHQPSQAPPILYPQRRPQYQPHQPHETHQPHQPQPQPNSRNSIMSFATDSTKLGEIPEHKWVSPRPGILGGGENYGYSGYGGVRPVFPLEPYVEEPVKRSRLRRLFGR